MSTTGMSVKALIFILSGARRDLVILDTVNHFRQCAWSRTTMLSHVGFWHFSSIKRYQADVCYAPGFEHRTGRTLPARSDVYHRSSRFLRRDLRATVLFWAVGYSHATTARMACSSRCRSGRTSASMAWLKGIVISARVTRFIGAFRSRKQFSATILEISAAYPQLRWESSNKTTRPVF